MREKNAIQQLKSLRAFAITGIVSIFLLFGLAITIFALSVTKQIHLHLAIGIVLLVWSAFGMYVGLMAAIWMIVAVNQRRAMKFFVNASFTLSFFSLNPFVIIGGLKVKKTTNAMIKEHNIPNIDTAMMRQKMYELFSQELNQQETKK